MLGIETAILAELAGASAGQTGSFGFSFSAINGLVAEKIVRTIPKDNNTPLAFDSREPKVGELSAVRSFRHLYRASAARASVLNPHTRSEVCHSSSVLELANPLASIATKRMEAVPQIAARRPATMLPAKNRIGAVGGADFMMLVMVQPQREASRIQGLRRAGGPLPSKGREREKTPPRKSLIEE